MTRPGLTGILLCCLALFTACEPQDSAAVRPAANFTATQLEGIGRGLQIPMEELPDLLPPVRFPKAPNPCGPAGLCVNPTLDLPDIDISQPDERKIALLSDLCGPDAYCTAEARHEVIDEMFASIDRYIKAILAQTCNAAKCDESIYAAADPLQLEYYQKICAASGDCQVHKVVLDQCVVAICNQPDTRTGDSESPPAVPPATTCEGNDEQCKKDQVGAAQDAHMIGLDNLESAIAKTKAAKKAVDDAQQAVDDATTEQQKKDAQAKLALAHQTHKEAYAAENVARTDLMAADVRLILTSAALEAGHTGDGTFFGEVVNGISVGVHALATALENNVGAVISGAFSVIREGVKTEHSRERYKLEQMRQEESRRTSGGRIIMPFIAQAPEIDPLNLVIPVMTNLPRQIEAAQNCAKTELCVTLVAYIRAGLNFQQAQAQMQVDTETLTPRPGQPGGTKIDIELPDLSPTR